MKPRDVEAVALLTLIYRELSQYCSVGPRTGPDDISTDIETGDEGLNLIRMISSTNTSELDWSIVRMLTDPCGDQLREFARGLKEFDPLRFEALLHAWPEEFALPASRLDQIERWEAVEGTIERFAALGLTAPFNEVFSTYVDAVALLTERRRAEVLDDYFETEALGYLVDEENARA